MATSKTEQAQSATPSRSLAVMTILLLVFFLGTSDNQMISALLPKIASDLGLSEGEVGKLMLPVYALAAAAAALIIGPLSDRAGRRVFLLYASILFGVSLAAASFINDIYSLAAVRLLTGLAAGVFSTCSIAYVGDYFPYERRGMAMSVVQAGYFAALVLGVPVANLLAGWQSWRASFIFFGAISGIAFFLIAMLLPDDKNISGSHSRSARRFDNIRQSFETRERVAGIFAALLVSGGFVGFFSYLGSWLSKDLRRTTNEVSLFFILVGFALLVGAFVAGPVSDKFGKRGVSIASTVVLAAMLFLIPRFDWSIILFVTFLLASVAFAFRQGPLQALATELVPQQARGAFVAVRNTASQIGIALSTAISGSLYDRSGYASVAVMSSAVTLAAAVCIMMMREPAGESVES